MEYLINFILQITGNPETGKWLVIAFVVFTVFAICIAFYFLLGDLFDPFKKRLDSTVGLKQSNRNFSESVSEMGSHFIIGDEKSLSYDRERLLYAGYHENKSLAHYNGIKILSTLLLPALTFVICIVIPGLAGNMILVLMATAAVFGYILPSFILDKQVKKRQRIIRNSFPDAIDQLIVCTEAGLGLDSGLQRVAKDTALSNEIMGYELSLVNAELRAGVDREKALKNLVTRTGVDEIRGLVSALSQSMRFGTSISDTLRLYADDLRDRRMQRAEEEAAKLAVKMLFPLGLCFFPGLFIVILGPAFIQINKVLIQQ